MKPAAAQYPDSALNELILFSNENLPLPKMPLELLMQKTAQYVRATVNEVKIALTLISPEEIPAYAKWLDKKIQKGFDCIGYEGHYDPISDTHRTIHRSRKEVFEILDDINPMLKNHNHKLSHRTSAILKEGLESLDDEIWSLNDVMDEARWEE